MKKNILYFALALFIISVSSCTKEQVSLNKLHGTWKFVSALDENGLPNTPNPDCTSEVLSTFYLCKDKEQSECEGVTKTTTVCTINNTTTTSINSSTFGYSVFENSQMVMGGAIYEIESLTKKDLKIHNVRTPKATITYEKQ